MDHVGLSAIRSLERVGKITDQEFNTSGRALRPVRHPIEVARFSGARPSAAILARLLRKHPVERSHTMIAATAFAVVGLVVVAFLNRIP
jgi:hypothetical protein